MTMWKAIFWIATIERAAKTFAQSLGAGLIVAASLTSVKWGAALDIAGLAALLSVLTSVGSGVVGGNPSLGNAEVVDPAKK